MYSKEFKMELKKNKKKNKDIDLTKSFKKHKKRSHCLNALAHWFMNLFVKDTRKNKKTNIIEI